ncbi:MAG: hypothetical protein IJ593_04865 [Lachnospiraceae bacterium]|nr:hypothetical protein [Lachnospiraceae bacterium]
MAILFTILSMLMTCGADLYEKKSVKSTTEEVLKTLIWYGIFNAILLCILLFFGMEEGSPTPFELISNKPIIVLPAILNYTCLFFALVAYKYVGVSVRNTFANTDGLFFILLLVIYYLTTGNAEYATRLFKPLTIIGLILVIGAGIIYPHIKDYKEKDENKNIENTSKLILILGIAISFISAFFDGAESMVSSTLIGDEIVDSTEYMLALSLIQVTITFFIWIGLFIKNKKPYNPFRKTEKYRFVSQLFLLVSDMFYVFALSKDALLGIILWSAFPILDIIGARILLKEKLSFLQYFVLIMMILGAVFVSLS